ncbi:MAG: CoA transferase [Pseudomonadota bacterium]
MRAFENVKVVDFTQVLAGPYATHQLALLGANVIKIEPPGRGDIARDMLDARNFGQGEFSPLFSGANINKRSVALDLKLPAAKDVVKTLITDADVLMQNFRPGVIDRLGFGYDAVREYNPRIVYCAVSGYGTAGPRSTEPAFDGAIQASSGLMASNGHASTGPTRTVSPVVDATTGLMAAFAIASALHRRSITGEGQYLDVAMLDSAVALLNPIYNDFLLTGAEPDLLGNQSLTMLPTANVFPTQDGYIQITAITQPHIQLLIETLGRPELLDDARYASPESQAENGESIRTDLCDALRVGPTGVWIEKLQAAGVPCAPIRNLPEVLRDPQLAHRRLTATLSAPERVGGADVELITTGFVANEDGPQAETFAPGVGQHTEAVLKEHGFSDETIASLQSDGAFG